MKHGLQQRMAGSVRHRAEQQLFRWPSQTPDWAGHLADAGVELDRVVHVRPDTRGVFLATHPAFGRCVLKTISDTQQPHRALAQLSVSEWLKNSKPEVFPEVLRSTSAYTLERYIEGRPFRAWLADDFDIDVMSEYFAGLRALVPPHAVYRWGEHMEPGQLWAICLTYIRKCLRHSRYFAFRRQVSSSVKILRRSGEFRERLHRLEGTCAAAQVPRALMCGDMGNVNLIVQEVPKRVVNIDYEFIGPGHWGFDIAYFLSSLAKWNDDPSSVRLMQEVAFDDVGLTETARALFVDLTAVLSDLSRTVYEQLPQSVPLRSAR